MKNASADQNETSDIGLVWELQAPAHRLLLYISLTAFFLSSMENLLDMFAGLSSSSTWLSFL